MSTIDFEQWKAHFERETNSSFVKTTGVKGGCEKSITYYYCNRSGYFNPAGHNMRALKSQGTAKLNAYCTAAIVLTNSNQDPYLQANICSTHHGHSVSVGHLRLQPQDRYNIAAKLSQGVTFDRILDDIREGIGGTIRRIHLTTRKDIQNIERAFGLRVAKKHNNKCVTVGTTDVEL